MEYHEFIPDIIDREPENILQVQINNIKSIYLKLFYINI